jgi:hypothetical protein
MKISFESILDTAGSSTAMLFHASLQPYKHYTTTAFDPSICHEQDLHQNCLRSEWHVNRGTIWMMIIFCCPNELVLSCPVAEFDHAVDNNKQ